MKRCKICGELKPLDEFYAAAGMRDGHRNDCKACNLAAKKRRYDEDPASHIARVTRWQQANRDRVLATRRLRNQHPERKRKQRDTYYRRTFGISADDVDAMLAAQGGGCAICRELPERLGNLHVDHCHVTGRIRGLLCSRCNHAIGLLREDQALFQRAADYLAESG